MSLALSACNLAPKYERPEVELPSSQFRHNKVSDTRAIQAASSVGKTILPTRACTL